MKKPRHLKPMAPTLPPPETIPLPDLARTALALAHQNFQAQVNELGRQAVKAVGRDPDAEEWAVDFDKGVMTCTKKKA